MDTVLQAYNRLGVKRYVVRGNDEFKIMMSVVPTIFHDITVDDCEYVSFLIESMSMTKEDVDEEVISETDVTGVDAIKQLHSILNVLISHIYMDKVKDSGTYPYIRENYPLYYLTDALRISREKILEHRMTQLDLKTIVNE